MTPDAVGPIARPFPLHRVSPAGVEATVEATEAERAALAADLGLPAIHRLEARFRLAGTRDRVVVKGRVSASIEQLCGVTLEAFPTELDEDVELTFVTADPRRPRDVEEEVELSMEHDPPEELSGDTVDLGAIAAEFLALGLDPFPRKPGVDFEAPGAGDERESPFAKLATLRRDEGER